MSTNQIIKGCLKNEIILYKNEKHVISKMNACHLTFEKSCVSKMRTCWLTFKKSMHFKYKCIRFSNLSLFVSGQFWVHDVLKSKRFCLRNKNPVQTVYPLKNGFYLFIYLFIFYLGIWIKGKICHKFCTWHFTEGERPQGMWFTITENRSWF